MKNFLASGLMLCAGFAAGCASAPPPERDVAASLAGYSTFAFDPENDAIKVDPAYPDFAYDQTSAYLRDAITREMQARSVAPAEPGAADLLVGFSVEGFSADYKVSDELAAYFGGVADAPTDGGGFDTTVFGARLSVAIADAKTKAEVLQRTNTVYLPEAAEDRAGKFVEDAVRDLFRGK